MRHTSLSLINKYPCVVLVIVALLVRVTPGLIFYGSCDVDSYAEIIACILNNTPESFAHWNYFPSISLYLWFAGFLAIKTALPLSFCIKVIPIICDSALVLLLYNMLQHRGMQLSFHTAMLYAVCPVPIIITTIHGQWESVFLFLVLLAFYVREYHTDSLKKYFTYGALFGFAILMKPIGLVLLLFFFVPRAGIATELGSLWRIGKVLTMVLLLIMLGGLITLSSSGMRLSDLWHMVTHHKGCMALSTLCTATLGIYFSWFLLKTVKLLSPSIKRYLTYQGTALAGLLVVIIAAFSCFIALGFDLLQLCDAILRYANKGAQGFGLPFAVSTVAPWLAAILKNRMILLVGIVWIGWWYYQQRVNWCTALFLAYAFIFACAGLCPQYLIWIIPYALVGGYYQSMLFFVPLTSLFYMGFYNPPSVGYWPSFFRISCAPLKQVSFLSPPEWMTHGTSAWIIEVGGNYIIPVGCLAMIYYTVTSLQSNALPRPAFFKNKSIGSDDGYRYIYAILSGSVIIVVLIFMYKDCGLAHLFDAVVRHRYDAYAMQQITQPVHFRSLQPIFAKSSPLFNCITLFFVALCGWTWYAIWVIRRQTKGK